MPKGKILPTSAPKPIPPEFIQKFAQHGWRRAENIWGRSTVMAWRRALGAERLDQAREEYRRSKAQNNSGAPQAPPPETRP